MVGLLLRSLLVKLGSQFLVGALPPSPRRRGRDAFATVAESRAQSRLVVNHGGQSQFSYLSSDVPQNDR